VSDLEEPAHPAEGVPVALEPDDLPQHPLRAQDVTPLIQKLID
jgi:hypothetical protein